MCSVVAVIRSRGSSHNDANKVFQGQNGDLQKRTNNTQVKATGRTEMIIENYHPLLLHSSTTSHSVALLNSVEQIVTQSFENHLPLQSNVNCLHSKGKKILKIGSNLYIL